MIGATTGGGASAQGTGGTAQGAAGDRPERSSDSGVSSGDGEAGAASDGARGSISDAGDAAINVTPSDSGRDSGGAGSDVGSSDGKTPITVWMAGDSTMDTGVCTGCGTTACGWGGQFQPLFNSKVTVVNKGKSGASIQTWLYGDANVSENKDANGECIVTATAYDPRWTAMLDTSNGMKPGDYLYIEFGINDDGTLCNRRVGPSLYQHYLDYMNQEAKKRGVQTIFATATAALECSGNMALVNRNFRTETKAAGAANAVPVIDLTVLTANLYTSLGFCPNQADYTSSTSKVGRFFCNDRTHFEQAGAQQIAQVVATALKDQGVGLGAYLK